MILGVIQQKGSSGTPETEMYRHCGVSIWDRIEVASKNSFKLSFMPRRGHLNQEQSTYENYTRICRLVQGHVGLRWEYVGLD